MRELATRQDLGDTQEFGPFVETSLESASTAKPLVKLPFVGVEFEGWPVRPELLTELEEGLHAQNERLAKSGQGFHALHLLQRLSAVFTKEQS